MNMTLQDYYCLIKNDCQEIKVYDLHSQETIYIGMACELPNELGMVKIANIESPYGPLDMITIVVFLNDR